MPRSTLYPSNGTFSTPLILGIVLTQGRYGETEFWAALGKVILIGEFKITSASRVYLGQSGAASVTTTQAA
jgi:L-asparagine transporter-like permease